MIQKMCEKLSQNLEKNISYVKENDTTLGVKYSLVIDGIDTNIKIGELKEDDLAYEEICEMVVWYINEKEKNNV